ncbi:MAG: sodium:solute symporter [Vicinamibacteria bacterium]
MTQFTWIDGSIIGLYLAATMVAGLMVRRYVGSVEHYLVAGREMDVHLGIASLAATEFGIVTCMYTAEAGYRYGFAGATPGILQALAMFFVGVTGFCIKPLREAKVMTLPELFERRFGVGVRRASGVVIVLGGLLNMGVFLRTGGEFLMIVTQFQSAVSHPLEWAMTALLVLVAVYTILGGMLSVLITDFLQFIVMSVGLIVVTALVMARVGWSNLADVVERHYGAAGFSPFANPQMGWAYVLFNACLNLAVVLTWQTTIARVMAAKDAKTGQRVYTGTAFFFVARFLIPGIWGIAALAAFPPGAAGITTLTAMPTWLSTFLPTGLIGLMLAAMLAADMSTDSSYMLTWASVIYNDIVAPWRRKGWTDKKGLLMNRSIVALIGVFLLLYGLWYPLKGDLWSYLGVTATIYLASMSTLLIACCYWSKANDWGAAGAIALGAIIPVAYLVLEQLPSTGETVRRVVGPYWSGLASYAAAGVAMVVGSLLKPAPRSA